MRLAACVFVGIVLIGLVLVSGCRRGTTFTVTWENQKPNVVKGTEVRYHATERVLPIGKVTAVQHSDAGSEVTISIEAGSVSKIRDGTRFQVCESEDGTYVLAEAKSIDAPPASPGSRFRGVEKQHLGLRIANFQGDKKSLITKLLIGVGAVLLVVLIVRVARRMWPLIFAVVGAYCSAELLGVYLLDPLARYVPSRYDIEMVTWIVAFVGGAIVSLILVTAVRSMAR